MVHGKNRIPYRIDRRLTGLAGADYDATISFGLPIEPEGSQYGESRLTHSTRRDTHLFGGFGVRPDYGLVKWVGAVVGPESNQPPSGVFVCVCENRTGVARSGALAMAVFRPAAWPDWFEVERQQRAARPPELAAIESAIAVILAKRLAVELTLYETPSPAARGSVGA